MLLAIDPGTAESAFVLLNGKTPVDWGKIPNEDMLRRIRLGFVSARECAIEMIAHYGTGMAVGEDVYKTVLWIGRYAEAWSLPSGGIREAVLLKRKEVTHQICNSVTARDANVRQAMLDRFGGKEKAIGNKKSPGPLYGMKADVWQALAVAVAYSERRDLGWKL